MLKLYTANFQINDRVETDHIVDECRILVGVTPSNLQIFSDHDKHQTNFTLSDSVLNDQDIEEYFQQIAEDLSKYLCVTVLLNEVIDDN